MLEEGPLFFWRAGVTNIEKKSFAGPEKTKIVCKPAICIKKFNLLGVYVSKGLAIALLIFSKNSSS